MIRLETSHGEVLSKILKDLSPFEHVSNRVVNRLLDGSYHVQVIGSPLKSTTGTIVSSFRQAERINLLSDLGTPRMCSSLQTKTGHALMSLFRMRKLSSIFHNPR